jgi:hypothetical protein
MNQNIAWITVIAAILASTGQAAIAAPELTAQAVDYRWEEDWSRFSEGMSCTVVMVTDAI